MTIIYFTTNFPVSFYTALITPKGFYIALLPDMFNQTHPEDAACV